MSKRTKLQKEYYKEFGNYKGNGKYSDDYVRWLENKVLAINYNCTTCNCTIFNCTTCNVEINYKGVCEMCYTELKLNNLD